MEMDLLRGAEPAAFTTNPDDPFDEGRIFVWSKMGWFERLEGPTGNVEFMPIAKSEHEMHEMLGEEELVYLGDQEEGQLVVSEFLEQSPLWPESPEMSDEPSQRPGHTII